MNQLLLGAISIAYFIAALFFVRFWKQTHDRFFLMFSSSFFIESGNRLLMGILPSEGDHDILIYSIRMVSYLLILFAIIDKNRTVKT